MGLWVQNVGVRSESMPDCMADKADSEGYWLPEPSTPGWSWASLREMGSFDELEALVIRAAIEVGSAAIGFSVHDEDSVYLVGGDPSGVSFRVVLAPRDFDAQDLGVRSRSFGTSGPDDFMSWTERWAPQTVPASVVRRLRREPAIYPLLVAAGLYPPPPPREPWEDWYPSDMHGASGMVWTQPLVGERLYTVLEQPTGAYEGPPGPWIILIAHAMGVRMAWVEGLINDAGVSQEELPDRIEQLEGRIAELRRPVVNAMVICPPVDGVFTPDPEQFEAVEDVKRYYEPVYCGRRITGWDEVPDAVEHDQAVTVAWLVELVTGRSVGEWIEAADGPGDGSQRGSSGS